VSNKYFQDFCILSECDEYQALAERYVDKNSDFTFMQQVESVCSICRTVATVVDMDTDFCRSIAIARSLSVPPLTKHSLGFNKLEESKRVAMNLGVSQDIIDEICEEPKTREGKLVKRAEGKVIVKLSSSEISKISEEIIKSMTN